MTSSGLGPMKASPSPPTCRSACLAGLPPEAGAILLGLGWWGMNRPEEPEDTFDDPRLAYAAVEQALSKMSGTIHETARTVSEKEMQLEKINYWK